MRKKHYHVLQGLRGCYLPDDIQTYPSKKAAITAAREESKRHNWDTEDELHFRRVSSGLYRVNGYEIRVTGPCYETWCACD